MFGTLDELVLLQFLVLASERLVSSTHKCLPHGLLYKVLERRRRDGDWECNVVSEQKAFSLNRLQRSLYFERNLSHNETRYLSRPEM